MDDLHARFDNDQVNDGAKGVAVGKVIAMLAEEGDDISNVEVPADQSGEKERSAKKDSDETTKATESSSPEASSSSKESESSKSERLEPAAEPKHAPKLSKPVMPSVLRLLADFNVSSADAESINGTGVKGRLTKGDVLTFLGKAQGPTGTYKEDKRGISAQGGAAAPKSAEGGPSGGAASTPPKSEVSTFHHRGSMLVCSSSTLPSAFDWRCVTIDDIVWARFLLTCFQSERDGSCYCTNTNRIA